MEYRVSGGAGADLLGVDDQGTDTLDLLVGTGEDVAAIVERAGIVDLVIAQIGQLGVAEVFGSSVTVARKDVCANHTLCFHHRA